MKTPYSIRDVCLIGVCLLMAGLAGVESTQRGSIDFGVWFFGLGALVLLLRPLRRRHTGGAAGQAPAAAERRRQSASGTERIEFDEHEIRRYLPDGRTESIAWDEIDEIGIVTTDEGPWLEDVFWLFLNRERSRGCAVSNNADGFKELLPRIQKLPAFDNAAVVQAMGSTANRSFVVWKNPAGGAQAQ